jgi:hypothetical protein
MVETRRFWRTAMHWRYALLLSISKLHFLLGLHDGCAIDRDSADPSQLPSKWLSELLLWGTKLALLAIFVQLYLFSRDARHGNVRHHAALGTTSLS